MEFVAVEIMPRRDLVAHLDRVGVQHAGGETERLLRLQRLVGARQQGKAHEQRERAAT
jgi:hypothetical protein